MLCRRPGIDATGTASSSLQRATASQSLASLWRFTHTFNVAQLRDLVADTALGFMQLYPWVRPRFVRASVLFSY